MKIPVDGISELKNGIVIGINVAANDESDGENTRESYINIFNEGSYWSNPAVLGELKMVTYVAPVINEAATEAEAPSTDVPKLEAPQTSDVIPTIFGIILASSFGIYITYKSKRTYL